MDYKRRFFRLTATAAAALFATAVAWAQDHSHMQMQEQGKQQTLKTGKKGEIVLNQETKAGDLTLQPGSYLVQHRVEGEDHFVHFTKMSKGNPYSPGLTYPKSHEGEIKCRIEPLSSKVAETKVILGPGEDGTYRIQRIEIAGENVAHLL